MNFHQATSGQKVNEMGRIGGRHSGSQVTPGLQVRNKRVSSSTFSTSELDLLTAF